MRNFSDLLNSTCSKGFIVLPLELVETLHEVDHRYTEPEAWIAMICRVNFRDKEIRFSGRRVLCRRGESVRGVHSWMTLLGWSAKEVITFFDKLHRLGYLEKVENPVHSTHIRIAGYDILTGKRLIASHTAPPALPTSGVPSTRDEIFEAFWQLYHEQTSMMPGERSRARTAWDNLTPDEQDRAIDGILPYYHSLAQRKYCRKAATYLESRAFD